MAWDNAISYSLNGRHHVLKNNVGFNAVISNFALSTDTIQMANRWNLTPTVTMDTERSTKDLI